MNVELMTITKHRRPKDLKEFVDYYLAIGFNRINLFDNESYFSVKGLFENYKNVTVREVEGQHWLQNDALYKHVNIATLFSKEKKQEGNTDWLAFFDDDEFLYIPNNHTVQEVLAKHEFSHHFYWKYISLPNLIEDRDTTLIDTFNYAALSKTIMDNHVHLKTAINLKNCKTVSWISNHTAFIDRRRSNIDEHASLNDCFYDKKDGILYHYFHQSWNDWKYKITRGGKDDKERKFYCDDIEEFKKTIEGKYTTLDNSMIERKKELGI